MITDHAQCVAYIARGIGLSQYDMSLSSLAHPLLLLLASHFVGRPPPTKSPQRNDEILRIIFVIELTESISRSPLSFQIGQLS